MAYYVKFKGLRGNVVRERDTKAQALELVEYLKRHGIVSVMGTIRADGKLARPKKEAA